MRHFSLETWSDYVRGVTAPSRRAEMSLHLERGCGACAAKVAALQAVCRLAENERQLDLPPGIEHSAKARFAQGERGRGAHGLVDSLRLVFDSHLASAAGVRGAEAEAGRQLIFTSADLSMDLRLTFASGRVRFVGEVVERETGHLAGAAVALVAGDEVVDRGATGEMGEFELEAAEGEDYKLRLELEERIDLEIPS